MLVSVLYDEESDRRAISMPLLLELAIILVIVLYNDLIIMPSLMLEFKVVLIMVLLSLEESIKIPL